MLKKLKIIAILFIMFMLLVPFVVRATDINMNLTADTSVQNNDATTTGSADDSLDDMAEVEDNADTLTPNDTTYSSNSSTISTLNGLPEASLGLTNVINIILIVIGVLLILLGIAIIIRLKH